MSDGPPYITGISNSEKRRKLFLGVDALSALPDGWDSYDGKPLDTTVANTLIELGLSLIPRVQNFYIVPCSDGSATIEWSRDGVNVEIHVAKAGS